MAFWFVKKKKPPPPAAAAAEPQVEAPPVPSPPDDGAEHVFQTRRLKSIEMIKTYRMNFCDDIADEGDYYYGTCQREFYYPPPQGHAYNLHRVAPPPLIRHVPAARALPAPQSHFHCGPPPPQVQGILPPQQPFCPAPPPCPHFAPSRGHFAPSPPQAFDCYGHY